MTLTDEQMQRMREISDIYFGRLKNRIECELTAARAEAEALRKDAERLKFQYSQYVKTCEAVGLGGVVSYEQWISAIDAARSTEGKK